MKFAERESDFDFSAPRTCASCGNEFNGRYCNRCGEAVMEAADKSFAHVMVHMFGRLMSVENRLVRTFRLMIFETGQYSINIMQGIRVPYIKPVAIFLLVNLLYFLFPVYDTFHAPLRTQMHFLPHNKFATAMVDEKIAAEKTSLADFTLRYEQHSYGLSRMLLILFVLLSALAIGFINYSNHFYFLDHLVVSFEYNTLLILLTQFILPWIFTFMVFVSGTIGLNLGFLVNDTLYALIMMVVCVLLFYLFEKRVYRQVKRTAWFKSVLIVPGLFIALQVYRIILFYATITTL